MGLVLACCAADAMCCVASGAIKCCCCLIPAKSSVVTRFMYTFGFFLMTVLAWSLGRWGHLIPGVPITESCDASCWKYLAVDRVVLGFVLYHSLLALMMIGVKSSQDPRGAFHNGWWPFKSLLCIGTIIGCFFIPSVALQNFWVASFIFSALFIIVQSMLLVDFAWDWSKSWVDKWEADEENVMYKWLLIVFTAGFMISCLVLTILLYVFFTANSGCGLNAFFITFNLLLALVMLGVSVLPKIQEANPRSGIFQASLLALYTTYLVSSAITTQPPDVFQCRAMGSTNPEDPFTRTMMYIGILITFIALGHQAHSAAGSNELFADSEGQDETDATTYNYTWFHVVFVMAGMYTAAVLTNWATLDQAAAVGTLQVDYGVTAMWIRVGTSWLCSALYLWTLAAPLVFPDRDFS